MRIVQKRGDAMRCGRNTVAPCYLRGSSRKSAPLIMNE